MTNAPRTILVVDDESSVASSIALALESGPYTIETSPSGEDALARTAVASFDLILCDMMMPGLSGLDLLKALRESRPEIRVIMITGYPTVRTAEEAVKLGAVAYIIKPFTPAEIRDAVARALAP